MRTDLHYYDIYPKVVPADQEIQLQIRPLSAHAAFTAKSYRVHFMAMTYYAGDLSDYKRLEDYPYQEVLPQEGCLTFSHRFPKEQEHLVSIYPVEEDGTQGKELATMHVFSLFEDLMKRRPFKGDLHVHTSCSDGHGSPEFVAARYRQVGFDFTTITDHRQWEPSERAIAFFKDVDMDFQIYHGEEVHAPNNYVHIVNFGGEISANDCYRADEALYFAQVKEIQATLQDCPVADKFAYASCLWVIKQIRSGGGMAIFAHPYWTCPLHNDPQDLIEEVLTKNCFDAFELLNGQIVNDNMLQVAIYHELRARGIRIPMVASSDSHGTVNNEHFDEIKTIVFAPQNTKDSIIDAVKACYTAAVDSHPNENYRVYGEFRMVYYTNFLMEEYFPLHDELCFEEGLLMKQYAAGDWSAKERLEKLKGRTQRLMDKYFYTEK